MTSFQWILIGLAIGAPWGIVIALTQLVKRNNYQQGRRAFHDGLSYNPKWGPDICRGWRDASREIPL